MQRLRALCDEHGIMLIADEVQSGAGRTGTLFAMEQMGVAPILPPLRNRSQAASAGGRHRARGSDGCRRSRRSGRHLCG
ncbi:aminotransferase class III-fold pyridoxal phosphate-dependent enzyme [Escherichia coli]